MQRTILTLTSLTAFLTAGATILEGVQESGSDEVSSRIVTTDVGERVLVHELVIDAPVADVWAAHTTAEGWERWAAPVAEVDLRVGGTILTHYTEGASIGDEGTNTLHILNYVPFEILTLRAEVQANWPDVMKEDADKLSNVILFDALEGDRTRLRSYGIGYREAPELDRLLQFFLSANEGLLRGLKRTLEADSDER